MLSRRIAGSPIFAALRRMQQRFARRESRAAAMPGPDADARLPSETSSCWHLD